MSRKVPVRFGAGENLEIEIKGLPIVKSVYPEEFLFYFSGVAHIRIADK
jgi:hypothetical protein